MKKLKFKAVIIPAIRLRHLGIIICVLLLSIILFVSLFPKIKDQNTPSENFYQAIINTQFHTALHLPDKDSLFQKILGFNPQKPIEILRKSQAFFSISAPAPKASQEPINTPSPTPVPTAVPKPIEKQQIRSTPEITNKTNLSTDTAKLLNEPLGFSVATDESVQILIIHTHTTESYASGEYSFTGDSDRNLDETKNITAVGAEIATVLRSHGLGVYHDTTVHDYPSYNGAYNRSLATSKSRLAEYPGVRIILDVHRDGITRPDGTKVKLVTDSNGNEVAQCMFVIGTNALLTHDAWQENLKLALKIQAEANACFPGLMRPIYLREERFNQQLSTGSIILEVGSNGNTLEEAKQGAKLVAQAIAQVLKKQ